MRPTITFVATDNSRKAVRVLGGNSLKVYKQIEFGLSMNPLSPSCVAMRKHAIKISHKKMLPYPVKELFRANNISWIFHFFNLYVISGIIKFVV